jgi:outer membrane protein TolC
MNKTNNKTRLSGNYWSVFFTAILLICSSLTSAEETANLTDILHQLEQVSPQLQVDKANAAATKAGIDKASSEYWGQVNLYGRDIHYDNARLVNPISPPVDFSQIAVDRNQYGHGATLSLPLDINGRIRARVNAQQYLNEAANYAVEDSRLQLFSQAVFLFRNLQRLTGVREALNKQHHALNQHYDITATAIRVGRLAEVELLRIEAEIKAVEGQLAAIDGDDSRLRANLAALLNQTQFTKQLVVATITPTHLSRIFEGALEQRPDIQRFKGLIEAEKENIKEARREWWPTLAVQADVSRNSGYDGKGSDNWSVITQLNWELWDGGRRKAQISEANAKKQAALQQKVLVFNQAKAEFEAARSSWTASQLQYFAAQAGLKAAIETEKIQSDRYQNGRLSSVDLLDAESALAQARSNLSSALAAWWLADDQLNLAMGKEPSAYNL